MKKTITALTLASLLSTPVLAATDKEKNTEMVGIGSGLVTGALVGGPVGAILGAAFGGLIADDINDKHRLASKDAQLAAAQQSLQQSREHAINLQAAIAEYQQQSERLLAARQQFEQSVAALESSIQFRTASDKLEDHYQVQLQQLAQTLKASPELNLNLTGYADARGEDSYNQQLSMQRVNRIKHYLLSAGVSPEQINVEARGEAGALSDGQQWEGDFFDRRVVMRLHMDNSGMMANNE